MSKQSKSRTFKSLEAAQREVDIQIALEGIRELALAMQTTEEIGPVVVRTRAALVDLGIKPFRTAIALCDEPVDSVRTWSAKRSQNFGYSGEGSLLALRQAESVAYAPKPKHKHWMMVKMNKRQLTSEFRKMRKAHQMSGIELPDDWLDRMVGESPIPYYHHNFYFMGGFIGIGLDRELDRGEIAIGRRVAETFGFAYKRLLELQEKEQRVREVEVEAALERVRSQALAMETSADIPAVSAAVYREMNALKFPTLNTVIGIPDEERNVTKHWPVIPAGMEGGEWELVYEGDVTVALEHFDLKKLHRMHPSSKSFFKVSPDGDPVYLIRPWTKPEVVRLMKRMVDLGLYEADQIRDYLKYFELLSADPYTSVVQFKHGYVFSWLERPLSQSEIDEGKRFVETFAFAYDRFLDLQDRERRVREAEVEAALERVRARALGMQESGEIMGVATALRNTFEDLGYVLDQGVIRIPDLENKAWRQWIANPVTPRDTEFQEARTHPLDRRQAWIKRWEQNEKYWAEQVDRDRRIKSIKNSMISRGVSAATRRSRIKALPNLYYDNFVSFGEGVIVFGCGYAFGQEDFEVAKRFADVFGVAYRRFRELEQKEAQNRELTIQNGLERVRARALGMQESHEIVEVAKLNYEEMKGLGYNVWRADIFFWSFEEDYWHFYGTQDPDAKDGMHETPTFERRYPISVIREAHANHRIMQELESLMERGDRAFVFPTEGDELRAFFSDLIPFMFPEQDAEATVNRLPAEITYQRFFIDDPTGPDDAGGAVDFITYDPMDEDGIAVGRRFADAFEFAYSRFRELKEKEEQNRELTIQNALERVRAKAQGMQVSEEISGVARAVYEGFQELGYSLDRATVVIHDDQTATSAFWFFSDVLREHLGLNDDEMDSRKPIVHNQGPDQIQRRRDARTRGEWHVCLRLEGEALLEDRRNAARWIPLSGEALESFVKREPLTQVRHSVLHSHGVINFILSEELTEADLLIAKRFTDVFDYAYDRFQELKEKEEQARAADQRAAVDRVRAEAAGMEGTEDIANVVKALWEGLQGQNVNYDFLSMEVIDEDANLLQAYAAIPDDSPILSLLAMEAQPGARRERVVDKLLEGVGLLRSEIPLSEAIEAGFSKADLSRTVLTDGGRDDRGAFLEKVWGLSPSADRRPSVKAVRAGFHHGSINLYTGMDVEITDETVVLVEALGDAVSLGFARYWDFRALEEKNRALEEANEEVRAATQMKSQFLASMSHELRTPMNAIIGFTRLVLRRSDNLADRQRENLEKVSLSANHLLTLINDILDLSKVEAGKVDLKPTDFNLPLLLEGCCATVGPTLGKPSVELICEIGQGVGELYADEDRLRQVMTNLLSNALKFTETGEVRVDCKLQMTHYVRELKVANCKLEGDETGVREMVEISVADTGIGIPEDQLGTIFEEFRQVDGPNMRKIQGTGLGLAITKRLIELMGGSMSVTSEVGKGSVFTVSIPANYEGSHE